jgi:hypothetical protein
VLTVEGLLVLDRGQVVAGGVQSSVVMPVDPFQSGQLDVVEPPPRAARSDQLGLEQPDLGLGQGVDAPISVKPPQKPAGECSAEDCPAPGSVEALN